MVVEDKLSLVDNSLELGEVVVELELEKRVVVAEEL